MIFLFLLTNYNFYVIIAAYLREVVVMSNFYLTVKKIVHVLAFICYAVIILYFLLCLPSLFGYKPSVVLSGSMEPTLKVGSVTYYKKVPKEQIFAKDIITFKSNEGIIVTHRIYSINGEDYITKGDANNTTDGERVSFGSVLGKNSGPNIPILGYFLHYLRTNVFAPILVVAILVFEYLFNTLVFEERKTTRRKSTRYYDDDEVEVKKTTKKKSTKKSTTRKKTTSKK